MRSKTVLNSRRTKPKPSIDLNEHQKKKFLKLGKRVS